MSNGRIKRLLKKGFSVVALVDSFEPKESRMWSPWVDSENLKFEFVDDVYYVVLARE